MRFLLRCTRPLALLLLAIILLPSLTAAAADYVYGQRSLAAGTTGSDVAELKKRLITTGYLAGSPSTTFDAATEKALTAFQGDFCLPATGRFSLSDLRTLERAFIEINAGRSLSPACKGVPPAPPAPPVPGTPSSGSPGTALTPYTVKAGDTLWGIANQYGTTVSAIQQTNGLSGSLIVPGQVLMIPVSGSGSLSPGSGQGTVLPPGSPDPSPGTPGGNGGATNGAASGGTGAYPTPTITRRHTVAAGENLDLIAARYGTTASVLAAFNSLSGPGLAPGQVLAIPRNAGAKFEVQGYFIGARIPESESYQAL
ncbi:MAG: LysM peptidoglycan-binding domain-containing protein, partial [Firmicutes bacterium]|nr:LysM peptidoglycan-binding domain-containing protein [Bacillota bacterium]